MTYSMVHDHKAFMQNTCNFCSQATDHISTAVLKDSCAERHDLKGVLKM